LSSRCAGGRTLPLAAVALAATLAAFPGSAQVPAGTVQFDQVSDTIQASGQTVMGTTATFEARVFLPSGHSGTGRIYNEWESALEDKVLVVGTNLVTGFAFSTALIMNSFTPVSEDAWHHVAFVHDGPGSEQRLYLDGVKIASQAASGDIADAAGSPFIGAIFRDGAQNSSFLGYLDTVRLSDNARYSGDSFTAPTGDLSDDDNTLLLFNFAAEDFTFAGGMATVADLSGNGHTGTFGTGFGTATYPGVAGTLDVDDDGATDPLTDGLLILRFLFGFTGTTLTSAAVGPDCDRCDAATIAPYIAALAANLDIDDDGALSALTDGLLVLRYLFGFTDATLTSGAVGNECDRCDAAAITPYLQAID
jgi:Concanavalin A-like lectin/glucanases superfamily